MNERSVIVQLFTLFFFLGFAHCKSTSNGSQIREVDRTEPSILDGRKVWTIHCAEGWKNPDGSKRVTLSDTEYRHLFSEGHDIDRKHCHVRTLSNDSSGHYDDNTHSDNGRIITSSFSVDDCSDDLALVKNLTFHFDSEAVTDLDMLCLGTLEPLNNYMTKSPEFAKFLIESRSQPAKIIIGDLTQTVQYQSTLHRVYTPWELNDTVLRQFNDVFSNHIEIRVSSDGTQDRPYCSFQSDCNWTDETKKACAKLLCQVAGYSRSRFVSATNNMCNTSITEGEVWWINYQDGTRHNSNQNKEAGITAICQK
jgi:hypothetical protein